jgi:ParB-like chromosome segregation protein Spo0J
MEYHDVANIFPMMSDEEYQALVQDIRAHGLREPIWTHEGKIIDGRNRYRACLEAGVEPRYREWDGNGSLVEFVVSLNVHRRHLNSGQKAVIALKLESQLAKEAKLRQLAGLKQNAPATTVSQKIDQRAEMGKAAEQAAALVGTNRQYVSDAKKIAQIEPDLLPEILKGRLRIIDAKRIVRLPSDRRANIVPLVISGEATDAYTALRARNREEERRLREKFYELAEEEPALLQYEEAVLKGEIKVVLLGTVSSTSRDGVWEHVDDREPLLEVETLAREFTGQTWHWPRFSGAVVESIQPHFKTLSEQLDVPLFSPEEWESFIAFDEEEALLELDFPGCDYFNWALRKFRTPFRALYLRRPWHPEGLNQRDYNPEYGRFITENDGACCDGCPPGKLFIRQGWGEWKTVEFNDGGGGRERRRFFRHDHTGSSFIQQAVETVDPFAFSHHNFKGLKLWQVQSFEASWAYVRHKTIPREEAIAALEADLSTLRAAKELSEEELAERALDWLQQYTPNARTRDEWREGTCTWPRRRDGTIDIDFVRAYWGM